MNKKTELSAIAFEHSIVLIYLFGSQAEQGLQLFNGVHAGADDKLADLDLGVVLNRSLPGPEEMPSFYSRLYNRISPLFKPLKLDLVLLQEQHSVFQAEAIYGICIYAENNTLKEDYEEGILRKAADFRPVLDLFYKERLEEVSR